MEKQIIFGGLVFIIGYADYVDLSTYIRYSAFTVCYSIFRALLAVASDMHKRGLCLLVIAPEILK